MAASTADQMRPDRKGGEEFFTHDEEDFSRIGSRKRRLEDDFASHETDEYSRCQGNDDPGHGDVFGFFQFHGIADSHETHQDVGLAEVADAPADGRDNGDDAGHAGVRYELEQLRRIGSDPFQYGAEAAVGDGSTPTMGTRTMARNIMHPWMKSVQQTAMKPPRKV